MDALKSLALPLILVTIAAVGLVLALPKFRVARWKSTLTTQSATGPEVIQPGTEEEIASEMAVDPSTYDRQSDMRSIRRIPSDSVTLEAAFRQRKNDNCEQIPAGQPIVMSQFTLNLTPRDAFKSQANTIPATRREVLRIGLNMLNSDQKSLPTLSRSTILRFLDDHYLSLQVRILKDSVTSKWRLHHRPIALVGQYTGRPLAQDWVDAISATVQDIRGLGVLEEAENSQDQISVLIFRANWLDERGEKIGVRHELAFVHVEPLFEGEKQDFRLNCITTADNRTRWHWFQVDPNDRPRSEKECDLSGTVRFDTFASNGLEPKSSVTRRMRANPRSSFRVEDIDAYLSSLELSGGWSEHPRAAIEAILTGKVDPNVL